MSTAAKSLRRDPAEVEPWAETCGQIRPLIEESDGAAAEVHHVEIQDAKLHYHERTDEVYYVIDGEGTMVLDDERDRAAPGRGRLRPQGRQAQGGRPADGPDRLHPQRRPARRSRVE